MAIAKYFSCKSIDLWFGFSRRNERKVEVVDSKELSQLKMKFGQSSCQASRQE